MITIFAPVYNEDKIIWHFINHYRKRFPNCNIVFYNNMSDDYTIPIIVDNGCSFIDYDTNNQICDSKYLEIKNNCWKNSETDWVLVCDADEFLDINENQLKEEENNGTTIIKSSSYHMINHNNDFKIENITHGVRAENHDKLLLFNKRYIKDINYEPGCHRSNPIGNVKFNTNEYIMYHYKFLNLDYTLYRYELFSKRLSPENKKNNWGFHYTWAKDKIISEYNQMLKSSVKLR